jgi:hypothetical protein
MLNSCTENPFFKDNLINNTQVIKGNVRLSDSSDLENIYVWLERFNVSTTTNEQGEFELKLPAPHTLPGGNTSWNDTLRLYYYVANYGIKSSVVLIENGEVVYGAKDVDGNGYINRTIYLSELISITTTVESMYLNVPYKIKVSLDIHDNPVLIKTYYNTHNMNTSYIIFKKIDSPLTDTKFILNICDVRLMYLLIDEPKDIIFIGCYYTLEDGIYEVITYIEVPQAGLPEALFNSISEYANSFTTEYLKVPFRQNAARFTIKNTN